MDIMGNFDLYYPLTKLPIQNHLMDTLAPKNKISGYFEINFCLIKKIILNKLPYKFLYFHFEANCMFHHNVNNVNEKVLLK